MVLQLKNSERTQLVWGGDNDEKVNDITGSQGLTSLVLLTFNPNRVMHRVPYL